MQYLINNSPYPSVLTSLGVLHGDGLSLFLVPLSALPGATLGSSWCRSRLNENKKDRVIIIYINYPKSNLYRDEERQKDRENPRPSGQPDTCFRLCKERKKDWTVEGGVVQDLNTKERISIYNAWHSISNCDYYEK
jgi:hypothetical protein